MQVEARDSFAPPDDVEQLREESERLMQALKDFLLKAQGESL